MQEPRGPYSAALAGALGSAYVAALVVGLVDVLLTLRGADGVSGGDALGFTLLALALVTLAGFAIGLAEGLVTGAVRATLPGGSWKAVTEQETDRRITALLLTGLVLAVVFAAVVAVMAMVLVAGVERKTVGALLLGGATVVALVFVALGGFPVYRVARRLAVVVPRVGPVPAWLLLLALAGLGAVAAGLFFVTTRLDWRALPLATPVGIVGFVVVQAIAVVVLVRSPRLARALAVVALVSTVLSAALLLLFTPTARMADILTVEADVARPLARAVRALDDDDGDGLGDFLGGGDCDDTRADVNPSGTDVPGNGIDENCLGGDATVESDEPAETGPSAAELGLAWKGNVLIIAVDTLRADRLGVNGYTRRGGKSLTPRIDALAAGGVHFTKVWSQSPNTPRSFPSMFFSRFPSKIRWDNEYQNYSTVLPENESMFEVLAAGGFHVTAVTSHFYFDDTRGVRQGFHDWDNDGSLSLKDSNQDVASPRTVARAEKRLAELAQSKERFVMLVHLFEPHSAYVRHDEFPSTLTGTEGLEERYDYEVAFVDVWVGKLLDALAASGVGDDTLVVLVSDHGEAFGVHRAEGKKMFFHGQTLYDELLRVPLIISGKGIAPARVDVPVMLIDLGPTLVDLVGLAVPAAFQGRSLAGALAGKTLPGAPAYAELLPAPSWPHSARMRVDEEGRMKLIYRMSDNVFELYDLAEDPEERTNVMRSSPVAEEARRRLAQWMESAAGAPGTP